MNHSKRPLGIFGTLTLIVLAFAACDGKSEDENGSGQGDSTALKGDGFASSFAAAYCEGISGCCEDSQIPMDVAKCKATLTSQLSAYLNQMASLKFTYDEDAAGECASAYRDALSKCNDADAVDGVNTVCDQVFKGTIELGGACSESVECIRQAGEDVYCNAGICTLDEAEGGDLDAFTAEHGKQGDPCSSTCASYGDGSAGCSSAATSIDSGVSCWVNDGFVCGAGATCEAAPPLGAACDNYCAPGAYCSGGKCVAQSETGSCAGSSLACSSASYCDFDSTQCTPKKADGAACDDDEECLGGECYRDQCRAWTVATAESCSGFLD